ncbi:Uma2 family endonuclease [Streptomyces spiralis]|uniref:Uma2 family endonuclease n=1 Tax=Streptomyces spiralis TaxID=66376 RepID=UPI00340ED27C
MDVFEGDYIRADNDWEEVVWVWKRMDAPKGCRVEVIEGLVTVAPYSAVSHHRAVSAVHRRLYEMIPESWGVHQRLPMTVPSRLSLYMPDLVVVPDEAPWDEEGHFVSATDAKLVMEITSEPTARHGRTAKAAGYATAGVPLYLLVDALAPNGPLITLYGEPKGDVYRPLATAKFGEPVRLPAPFDAVIDTSEFPAD